MSREVENQRRCVAPAVWELAQGPKPTGRRNCLPGWLLTDPEMLHACRVRDFARVFRLVKTRAGIYPSMIARRCELTPSRVGEVIAGRRQLLHMDVVERIADGLRIPGHMLGLARRSWVRFTRSGWLVRSWTRASLIRRAPPPRSSARVGGGVRASVGPSQGVLRPVGPVQARAARSPGLRGAATGAPPPRSADRFIHEQVQQADERSAAHDLAAVDHPPAPR
ncbi:helix-turn-helix domain-containing protein [Streptomyces mirabilis]|uniref:helix-turn-helix domain-containing protein n=1 Tax=Streptomyces mirabilis TaxID=68239 RepID=UPI003CCF0493